MKKTIFAISAVLCLMLTSCGSDFEQTASEPAAVTAAPQSTAADTETETNDTESTFNADCCIPQTTAEPTADKNNVPNCCSPDFSEIGDCCGD